MSVTDSTQMSQIDGALSRDTHKNNLTGPLKAESLDFRRGWTAACLLLCVNLIGLRVVQWVYP